MSLVKNEILRLEILISHSVFLKWSGIAYLLLSFLFILVMKIWDFHIIDEMYNKEIILTHIGTLCEEQKHVHIFMTATLDVVFPFTYGLFQAGMALKYFGS